MTGTPEYNAGQKRGYQSALEQFVGSAVVLLLVSGENPDAVRATIAGVVEGSIMAARARGVLK